ncbi:NADH-quinone oxidoreductase subunit C [Candidatus Zinderia endosymbiont of Aphrophora alni]|uniref:NADH-quinone oxidoreductase subunit C n=1 Tax=Candidatus Zinderia endosymbiont of Aphrophora alni TaxID=3077951 RepID=UPI0030CFA84E
MKNEKLKKYIFKILGNFIEKFKEEFNEITIVIKPKNYLFCMKKIFNNKKTQFKKLIDICGVDYLTYKNKFKKNINRFAVIYHLLSIKYNWRLRIKVFIKNNNNPKLPSLTNIWKSANWYEREIYDLYGIIFTNHKNLNRILTDYNFIGHPLRKDFLVYGYTEIYYDNSKKNVNYKIIDIKKPFIPQRIIK